MIFDALLWVVVPVGKRVQPRRGCAFLLDVTAKLLPQQQQAQPKGPAFFFCTGRHGRRAGERKRREALGMGSKSSKVSNVHNDEAGSGGGKTSGSVIDKLTEAQLDEFREAFNSFDKVRSAPG